MKFLWGFSIVPTVYVIYIVVDKAEGILKFVRECSTKGEALDWINKYGEENATYSMQTHYRKR